MAAAGAQLLIAKNQHIVSKEEYKQATKAIKANLIVNINTMQQEKRQFLKNIIDGREEEDMGKPYIIQEIAKNVIYIRTEQGLTDEDPERHDETYDSTITE